jgi:pSer/pThr/pTyr-binding forkhead associated (FHA) protein
VWDDRLFLTASGMTTPLHLDLDGPAPGRLTLPQPFAVIGRHPQADVVLDDEQVSERHAYLQVVAGRVFCADLASRTGTHRPGTVGPAGWLGADPTVRIGPYTIRLRGDDRTTPAAGDLGLPEITLEFLGWTTGPVRWPMRRPLVLVGRSHDCGVRLPGLDVSKHHCSLVRTPMGLWVVDLLGRGIRVNGEPVRCARLGDGDELRVGPVLIRPRYDESSEPGARRLGAPRRGAAGPPSPRTAAREDPPARGGGPGDQVPLPRAPSASISIPELIAWPVAPEQADRQERLLAPLVHQFGQMQQQMFDQFHQAIMMMFQMFGTLHRDQMGLLREEIDRVGQLTRELQELKAEVATASPDRSAREAPTAPPPVPSPGNGAWGVGGAPPVPARTDDPTGPPPDQHAYEEIHTRLHQRIVAIQHERQDRWQKILSVLLGRLPEDKTMG